VSKPSPTQPTFFQLILPVLFLSILIGYGLIWRPLFANEPALPLEVVFLLAGCFSIAQLLLMGYDWSVIQHAIIKKISKGFPAILILFAIGIIIGSWIVSGTIPMLVYWGIKIIAPQFIYLLAFVVPIVFSLLTGTSWGSVGTIGVVILGVATTIGADLGIVAGAVVGGAYFGDKLSPLSDTTNMASIATEVNLYDHIRSMMNTTLPSALIAAIVFFVMGYLYPASVTIISKETVGPTLDAISGMFHFHFMLLIPPIIVLYGSITRKPTLPVLLGSSLTAIVLALLIQDFKAGDILMVLATGFETNMAINSTEVPEVMKTLFNRGGLYELNEAIMFTFMVFVYIGSLDILDVMPTLVRKAFGFVKKKWGLIVSSLLASAFTNATTSNQSATSFIVGDAFKKRYDEMGIPRKVLSRSIEDYGTMVESIIPWTATAIFMAATTGVAFADYWHWQLLSLINLVVAPLLAITGIGCFYNEERKPDEKE
jgi:NhaC family Na+:H+ antiporter